MHGHAQTCAMGEEPQHLDFLRSTMRWTPTGHTLTDVSYII